MGMLRQSMGQTRSCHSNPSGRPAAANSRWITRRGSGFEHEDDAWTKRGRINIAPPLGTVQTRLGRSLQVATSSAERQPGWWEFEMTRSGPLSCGFRPSATAQPTFRPSLMKPKLGAGFHGSRACASPRRRWTQHRNQNSEQVAAHLSQFLLRFLDK